MYLYYVNVIISLYYVNLYRRWNTLSPENLPKHVVMRSEYWVLGDNNVFG